jgi:hypothetical protein
MPELHKSAITITYQKAFIDWNNKIYPELPMEEEMLGEASTYLVNESFDDPEELLEKHYKQIFKNELKTITEDESKWPNPITTALFDKWFYYEISDTVIALD